MLNTLSPTYFVINLDRITSCVFEKETPLLIQEKIKQSITLLREFGEECWITFTRESAVNGDPTLTFLSPVDLTWGIPRSSSPPMAVRNQSSDGTMRKRLKNSASTMR